MRKKDFVRELAGQMNCTLGEAEKACNGFIAAVEKCLKEEGKISLIGFGTYEVRDIPARSVYNPQTRGKTNVPAYKKPTFRFGKSFRDKF